MRCPRSPCGCLLPGDRTCTTHGSHPNTQPGGSGHRQITRTANRSRRRQFHDAGSSTYIMLRDPARAIRRGRQLFQRKFTDAQGFGPRTQDGIGDIHATARHRRGTVDSCAGCHGRPRGSAGFGGDVVTKPDSRDAPHLFGLGLQEMLADEITGELRDQRQNAINEARSSGPDRHRTSRARASATAPSAPTPNGTVDTNGVGGVNTDLRVRPFFAQGDTTSIREFVVGAFNDEMGLQAVDPLTAQAAAGERVVTPTGMVLDGATDLVKTSLVSNASRRPGPRRQGQRDPHLAGRFHGVLSIQLLQAGRRISTPTRRRSGRTCWCRSAARPATSRIS